MQRALTGFAADVMVAASIWSLIVPAIEQSDHLGRFAFLPAFAGFWFGILFLLALDHVIPHLHRSIGQTDQVEGPKSKLSRTIMLVLAVTLHNIPEGMAVGVVYAGLLYGSANITAGGALALALGIAIQNFPEGAIISMPLYAEGESKPKSFWLGVLSGAVEPVFGGLTVLVASLVVPGMPYLLSFFAIRSGRYGERRTTPFHIRKNAFRDITIAMVQSYKRGCTCMRTMKKYQCFHAFTLASWV